jgi:hypothetical protein
MKRRYIDPCQELRCWINDDGTVCHSSHWVAEPDKNDEWAIKQMAECKGRLMQRVNLITEWLDAARMGKWEERR